MSLKRRILCGILGIHAYRGWVAHTNGPCVFVSEAHIFRKCARCRKFDHQFASINDGDDHG